MIDGQAMGAVGILRFPDTYTRIHAAGLISGLGIGSVLVAALIFFIGTPGYFSIKAIAVIIFGVLTAPVATHMIGRAAYKTRVSLWGKSVIDELGEKDQD